MASRDDDRGRLGDVDLDVFAFRDSVLRHLADDDEEGLRDDGLAVLAPIFCERFIDEIGPGNPWNDLLFLMTRKLLETSPELRHLSAELEAKRIFASRPDARLEDLVVVGRGDRGVNFRLR